MTHKHEDRGRIEYSSSRIQVVNNCTFGASPHFDSIAIALWSPIRLSSFQMIRWWAMSYTSAICIGSFWPPWTSLSLKIFNHSQIFPLSPNFKRNLHHSVWFSSMTHQVVLMQYWLLNIWGLKNPHPVLVNVKIQFKNCSVSVIENHLGGFVSRDWRFDAESNF